MKRGKSAARHLIDARLVATRARRQVHHLRAELERSRMASDADTVRAETALKRAEGRLRKAEKTITKYQPIARSVAVSMQAALRLEPKAKRAGRRWHREREKEGKRPARTAESSVHKKNALVDSPYGSLHAPDQVQRVVNTIEAMHKRGQIDARQKMAFDRFRWSFEACPDAIRCALDQSGRGGGAMQRSPSDDQLQAAEWLREARDLLGVTDYKVVFRVCGEGMSLEDVARARCVNGRRPSQREVDVIGSRLRTAGTVLADHWWPIRTKLRTSRAPDAKPLGAIQRDDWDPSEFKGRVAHAADSGERGGRARGRVFGFEPKEGQPDLKLTTIRRRKRKERQSNASGSDQVL